MLNIKVTSNTKRANIIVTGDTTVRDCFSKAGVGYTGATITLDGRPLKGSDFDKTLDELGVVDSATLMAIVKMDNAR